LVSENVDTKLVKSDVFGDGAVVREHLGANTLLSCFGQSVLQHEVVQEAVQARNLIDQRHVAYGEGLGLFVDGHLREDLGAELVHVDN